jgi:hypothetical protein
MAEEAGTPAGRSDSSENPGPVLKVFYADAALADQQPRVTDLLPTRWRTLTLWFLIGVVVIAMHLLLGIVYHDRLADQHLPIDSLLNAQDPGSLASWTAAMMLMLASLTASLIYWIRRNKIDDYRGRYRMWIYITGLLVLASLDATAGLRRAIVMGLNQAAPEAAAPSLVHFCFAMFGIAIIARLIAEMQASRGAVAWLVASALAYTLASLTHWNWIPLEIAKTTNVAVAVLTLSGHWLLTMSMMVYGRYVFLDAQGMISHSAKPKWKKSKARKPAENLTGDSDPPSKPVRKLRRPTKDQPSDENPDVIRMDAAAKSEPAQEPERSRQSIPQQPRKTSQQNREPDDLDSDDEQHMSKSARKKARKEKRRQQRAA